MNIVVCCKFVPSMDDLVVNDDRTVSLANAEWKINEADLNAVQVAVNLVKTVDGQVTALTVGDSHAESTKLRKDLLSRGPDKMMILSNEAFAKASPIEISEVLCTAIKEIDADLVICGEGSDDYYNQQTGIQLGTHLGWSNVHSVDSIAVEDGVLVVERMLEKSAEVLEIELPAVLSVTKTVAKAQRPNMRDVLAAGKKPVEIKQIDTAPNVGLKTLSVLALENKERKQVLIDEGSSEEKAEKFVSYLKAEGVL